MRIARATICYLLILSLLFFGEIAAMDRYRSLREERPSRKFSPEFSESLSLRDHLVYIGYYLYKLLHNNNNYSRASKKEIDRIFGNSVRIICTAYFWEDKNPEDDRIPEDMRKPGKGLYSFSLDLNGCHFGKIYDDYEGPWDDDGEDDDNEWEDDEGTQTDGGDDGDDEQDPSSDGTQQTDDNAGTDADGTGTALAIIPDTSGNMLINPSQFPVSDQNTMLNYDPTLMQNTGMYGISTDTTGGMSDYSIVPQAMPQNYGDGYVDNGTLVYGNGMYNGSSVYNNGGMYYDGMSDYYSPNMGMNTYYQGFNGVNGMNMNGDMPNGMNEYNTMSDFQNSGQNPNMYQQQNPVYQNFQPGTEYNSGASDQTMMNNSYGGADNPGTDIGTAQMQRNSQDFRDMDDDSAQSMRQTQSMYTDSGAMDGGMQDTSSQFVTHYETPQQYSMEGTNMSGRAMQTRNYPREQEAMNMEGEMQDFSRSAYENQNSAMANTEYTTVGDADTSQYSDNVQQNSTQSAEEQEPIDNLREDGASPDNAAPSEDDTRYEEQFSTPVDHNQRQTHAISEMPPPSRQAVFQTETGGRLPTSFARRGFDELASGGTTGQDIIDTETLATPQQGTVIDGSIWSTQPVPDFEWDTAPQEEIYDPNRPLRSWEF